MNIEKFLGLDPVVKKPRNLLIKLKPKAKFYTTSTSQALFYFSYETSADLTSITC